MFSKRTSLLIAAITPFILAGQASLLFGQQLRLDTQIETPPQNNNALELPEKQAGDTIQFQLFAPGASGRQIQGYTVELALRGKTFGSYIDDVSGSDLNGSALLSRVSATGNPTLSMLSVSAVTIPASGYLGKVNLNVSRALTSSDSLAVQSASIAGPGGVQDLDVSRAVLTFASAALCPGDFDGNGKVNFSDFIRFASGFGARSGDAGFNAPLDLDGNGAIEFSDFIVFASEFGTTCDASPPVRIPDANLRAVIEDSLGKEKGAEITRSEMAKLTRLEAPNAAIRHLTGLEYAVNLKWLDLGEAAVDGQPRQQQRHIGTRPSFCGCPSDLSGSPFEQHHRHLRAEFPYSAGRAVSVQQPSERVNPGRPGQPGQPEEPAHVTQPVEWVYSIGTGQFVGTGRADARQQPAEWGHPGRIGGPGQPGGAVAVEQRPERGNSTGTGGADQPARVATFQPTS